VASYRPDGTAQANKAWFDAVNTKLSPLTDRRMAAQSSTRWWSPPASRGSDAGDSDKTSINGGVDSILFSVKIGDSCLLGPSTAGRLQQHVEPCVEERVVA
jgi:hypothetical protein